MAETTATTPAPKKKGPSPVLEGVSSFLKTITWLAVGFVFLFVGVVCKIKRPIPASWEPFFTQHIPHLPYFLCGFGFIFLAQARSFLRKEYQVEQKKDFYYPHAWKVSLLGTQVFLLRASGAYAILYGLGLKWVPSLGMLGLVFFMSCFLVYLLWYQIEYFKNRLPALASLRIAMMSFILAGLSFILWSGYQMIVPSILLAFLAVFAGFYSLGYEGTVQQRLGWLRSLFMIGAVAFLGAVAYYVLAFWKPQAEPLDTVVVAKGLRGEITDLTYSPKGDAIAFAQKYENVWSLKFISPETKAPVTIKLGDIEGPFHMIYTRDGKNVLLDGVKGDDRELIKVDVENGSIETLVKSGVVPFDGGLPMSSSDQFLFTTKDDKGYHLNCRNSDGKLSVLFESPNPILSPSWAGDEVVFVDGIHATPFVLNSKNKEAIPLITEQENKDTSELTETDPLIEVLPSPDHFRYLCVGLKNDQTTIWTMLMDTSKKVELYKSGDKLSDISWLADGQKIVFERNGLQLGFKSQSKGVVVLNANLATSENLVPPQVNVHSPTLSPDGIKIAFVGSEGLWYPSIDSGIWVVVLR